jgi:hypothetical protein
MSYDNMRARRGRKADKAISTYLRGPIAWAWLRAAMLLPGSAIEVGLVLWHYRALNRSPTFTKGTGDIARFLTRSPSTVRRAIDALAGVGLIEVDCAPGRKCKITMVEVIEAPQQAACMRPSTDS